jgi:biopolymer transport protein ExbB/TolQ
MFEFIRDNMAHVAPILLAGAFAVAIIFERSKALFQTYPIRNKAAFFEKLQELVLAGKLGEAISLCDKYPLKPAAKVAKEALLRAHQPENLIEQGIELTVGENVQAIQKRTSFLATIANVATLLGLFGTIAGLIHAFEAVGHADPQQKSAMLSAGISTAMNATMMGLAVAIPTMIAFSFLMNRQNRLIADVDHSAVKILDILKQRYYAAEAEALNPRMHSQVDDDDEDAEEHFNKSNGRGNGKVMPLRRVA